MVLTTCACLECNVTVYTFTNSTPGYCLSPVHISYHLLLIINCLYQCPKEENIQKNQFPCWTRMYMRCCVSSWYVWCITFYISLMLNTMHVFFIFFLSFFCFCFFIAMNRTKNLGTRQSFFTRKVCIGDLYELIFTF